MRGRQGSRLLVKGLTPLLDILFILLFAILALSDVRTSNRAEQVLIRLPHVEPGLEEPGTGERHMAIVVGADSNVHLAETGEAIASREDLDLALSAVLGEVLPEEVVIEIQADRDAPHGVVVELLQHLRLRGFVNVQLLATGYRDLEGPFGGER